ncbi:hypothetical protein [Microcoleus sp. FACHB-672]|uniref:hypothetical protein n=1 Tax=Microcoleus sp. FACHB-672 TaxID=2692825 RepID=UPI001683A69A|nr:hypothetical protein [Microcoleus sp. FACHB-672]MBD2040022.1 hypothetical protein [Microcoleus sp. FACHB-672]
MRKNSFHLNLEPASASYVVCAFLQHSQRMIALTSGRNFPHKCKRSCSTGRVILNTDEQSAAGM